MSTDPRDEALKRIEAYGRRVRLYTEDPCGETTAELIDAKAALTAYTENRLAEISRLTAELEEARKDAGRHDELSRDPDGDISIDYSNAAGMFSLSFSPTGRMFYVMNVPGASQGGGVEVAPECHAILEEELRIADAAMTKEKP